jgi:hypothetical protein
MKALERLCIQAAQVTTPKQLPKNISPLNHPYVGETLSRPASPIRNQRWNKAPLARALTQYAIICKTVTDSCSQQKGNTVAADSSGAMQHVTVVPQLPYAESSRSCKDFISANLQASVQKEVMLQQGEGVKQEPAFKRSPSWFREFVIFCQTWRGNISIVHGQTSIVDTHAAGVPSRNFKKNSFSHITSCPVKREYII